MKFGQTNEILDVFGAEVPTMHVDKSPNECVNAHGDFIYPKLSKNKGQMTGMVVFED